MRIFILLTIIIGLALASPVRKPSNKPFSNPSTDSFRGREIYRGNSEYGDFGDTAEDIAYLDGLRETDRIKFGGDPDIPGAKIPPARFGPGTDRIGNRKFDGSGFPGFPGRSGRDGPFGE